MATVRFSQELIKNIEKNAHGKMQPAVDRARAQRPDNSWGQRIYDTLFFEVKAFISQVPAGWYRTIDSISVESVMGVWCGLEFKFSTPQPWPYEFVDTPLATKSSQYSDHDIVLKHNPAWREFAGEVRAYNERVEAAVARQREFINMVEQVVKTYATLAPALKAWPPLWELIPEDVKDKHREIKEREKKETKLDVDLSKLTAMSTAAKFGI